MTQWPSSKAAKVFRALLRKGYTVKSQKGLHIILTHPERGDYVWAFHDAVEIGENARPNCKANGIATRRLIAMAVAGL